MADFNMDWLDPVNEKHAEKFGVTKVEFDVLIEDYMLDRTDAFEKAILDHYTEK